MQRLKYPTQHDNGFAFGGGLARGGFNKEAWAIVRKLCSFDYMGAAEFEFGALPRAFQKMFDSKGALEAYTLVVRGQPEFPFGCEFDYLVRERAKKCCMLEATVFVLAPAPLRPHVEQTIQLIAEDRKRLDEMSLFRERLFCSWTWTGRKEVDWERSETQGWLELDNGFMFFADKGMWFDFSKLFGVITPSWADVEVVEPDFAGVELLIRALELCVPS